MKKNVENTFFFLLYKVLCDKNIFVTLQSNNVLMYI